jgi:hypothetical protein
MQGKMTTVARGWRGGWDAAARASRRICCALVDGTGGRGASRGRVVGSRLAVGGWAPHDGTHHLHRVLLYHRHGSDRMAEEKLMHNMRRREMCTTRLRGDCSDIEEADETTGDTPLMAAARRGDDASSVSALLDSGASVRARNKVRPLMAPSLVTPHPSLPVGELDRGY